MEVSRTVIASLIVLAGCPHKAIDLVEQGEVKGLRPRAVGMRSSAPETSPLLVLGLDGVSRELLYDMLRAGKLPHLAELLGGDHLAHAYLDDSLLSTLPSSTMAAWVTAFTGVPPAAHGVAGNEYFIRETRTFACPAPVSFSDANPTLEIYTDGAINKLTDAPTVYERVHRKNPDALVWVAMSQVYRGADWLLLAKRTVIASAFEGFLTDLLEKHTSEETSGKVYADLDEAAVRVVDDHLAKGGPPPDVLTLYLSGTDLLAHVAKQGPDEARRTYLATVVDPAIGTVVAKLRAANTLDNRWVLVTADHGHTEVVYDEHHALAKATPDVLTHAGFRLRAFKRDVPATDPFSAVLAYGGAMAYVYVADRSQCAGDKDACPWAAPPRYEQDVLPAADAFYRANEDGTGSPGMMGTLDLILTRRPRPFADIDLPFEVYVGQGKTMPIEAYLADHPHPTYVALAARLRDLAVGLHGERAGDILLIAHNGDRARPEDRYYFASPYRSWHGSPSRADSEIPLIVAHAHDSAAAIGKRVKHVLGDRSSQQKITDLMLDLSQR